VFMCPLHVQSEICKISKINSLLTNEKLFIIVALEFKLALMVHKYSSPLEYMKRRFVF
jgi:hypothetical protein